LGAALTSSEDGQIVFFDVVKKHILKIFQGHLSSLSLNKLVSKGTDNRENSDNLNYNKAKSNSKIVFSFSSVGKYVCSGNKRNILIWDPFTLDTIYTLPPFASPVLNISIQDSVEILFIATVDKNIYCFHHINFEIIQKIYDKTVYRYCYILDFQFSFYCFNNCRPENKISSMLYIPPFKKFYTVGNILTCFNLEK
jgi:WD40 repeat protein